MDWQLLVWQLFVFCFKELCVGVMIRNSKMQSELKANSKGIVWDMFSGHICGVEILDSQVLFRQFVFCFKEVCSHDGE